MVTVICMMAPPIHLGAWSMALMLWLPFELLLLGRSQKMLVNTLLEGECSGVNCTCLFHNTNCRYSLGKLKNNQQKLNSYLDRDCVQELHFQFM